MKSIMSQDWIQSSSTAVQLGKRPLKTVMHSQEFEIFVFNIRQEISSIIMYKQYHHIVIHLNHNHYPPPASSSAKYARLIIYNIQTCGITSFR